MQSQWFNKIPIYVIMLTIDFSKMILGNYFSILGFGQEILVYFQKSRTLFPENSFPKIDLIQ